MFFFFLLATNPAEENSQGIDDVGHRHPWHDCFMAPESGVAGEEWACWKKLWEIEEVDGEGADGQDSRGRGREGDGDFVRKFDQFRRLPIVIAWAWIC